MKNLYLRFLRGTVVLLGFQFLFYTAAFAANIKAASFAPAITSFSPSSGPVGTLITINGSGFTGATDVEVGSVPAIIVSNSGTKILAMVMPNTTTGTVTVTAPGGGATSTSSFTVSPDVYPTQQQGTKLTDSDIIPESLGQSAAISADGNTLALRSTVNNQREGGVSVFVRNSSSWTRQLNVRRPREASTTVYQGSSVALSADGNTMLVGIAGDTVGVPIFKRTGTTWTQLTARLFPSGTGNRLGASVALSADGNTAVVNGCIRDTLTVAWVFKNENGTWMEQGQLNIRKDSVSANVAISADGNTVIAGPSVDNHNEDIDVVKAFIYTRSGNVWSQQTKLVPTDSDSDPFEGESVALSADGNTAIIGNSDDVSNGETTGSVWFFIRNGSTWSQQGNKISGTTFLSFFGDAVSLNADGNTAIVGAYNDTTQHVGDATLYRRVNGQWSQYGNKLIGTGYTVGTFGANTQEGYSVAISADGTTAAIGGTGDNGHRGAGWVFVGSGESLLTLHLSAGTLSPSFSSSITNYTESVTNAVTSVTVTARTTDTGAIMKVNGVTVASGTASQAIALNPGANIINILVTASDGTAAKIYTVTVTRAPSANDNLATLHLSAGTLSPSFSASTTSYSESITNAVSNVTVTARTADSTATMRVNGVVVASGTTSPAIALNAGANAINVVVTAADGTTTKTYTVTVTRAPSANDNLATLHLSAGTLAPSFAATTTSYTESVTNAVASVTVTARTADSTATMTVNGTTVISGTTSPAIALNPGANIINIVVTAGDGTTTKTYAVTVTRAPSANDNLATLHLSAGTLSPSFVATTTSYSETVTNAVASVTVTARTADSTATMTVDGIVVASGTTSQPIALNVGANAINVAVTAGDGTTAKTYTVTVTRAAASGDAIINKPIVVHGNGDPSTTIGAATSSFDDDILLVHQAVSPNGDGLNDVLIIDGILAYPDNKLQVMDSNGKLVYTAKGYDNNSNAFDGHSNITGKLQQAGTYFYSLEYTVKGQSKHKTGYIVLKY